MPKKGELASAQRLQDKVSQQYPGEDATAVILRLYQGNPQEGIKPLGTKHIARQFGTSDKTIKGLIPQEFRRDRGENGRINREFSGQVINTSGLAAHNRDLQADRQRRLASAEHAVEVGIDSALVQKRFHLERRAINEMVREHRGLGRRTRLDHPRVRARIWRKEIMDQLLNWQGTQLDQEIILKRILVDTAPDRLTLKQIAEQHGYDLTTVGNRERAILEEVGVLSKAQSQQRGEERTA